MAKLTLQPNTGENTYQVYKIDDSGINDNDVNKPVTFDSTDTVALAADSEEIYGFIEAVERHTADGKVVVTVQIDGRRKVTLDGAAAVGTVVEAAANAAAGTANSSNWGLVSVHTPAAADNKRWMVISGTGLDEADCLVELQ